MLVVTMNDQIAREEQAFWLINSFLSLSVYNIEKP